MTWHRYIYKPLNMPLNITLHNEIQQMLVNCAAGHRPVHHVRPFTICYPVRISTFHTSMADGIAHQLGTLASHISQYPHYQQLWVNNGHTMHPNPTDPYLLARIWIRQRGHGLNWLAAAQIVDASDFAIIQKSTWSPHGHRTVTARSKSSSLTVMQKWICPSSST
jgi:hypothetical protein